MPAAEDHKTKVTLMPVVHIPASLRDCTNGQAAIEVACDTTGELLAAIKADYSDLAARILDENGDMAQHMQLFIDAQQTDASSDRALTPTSDVLILSPLAGG